MPLTFKELTFISKPGCLDKTDTTTFQKDAVCVLCLWLVYEVIEWVLYPGQFLDLRHDSSSVFAKPVEVQWGRFNSCSPVHVDSAGDLSLIHI